MEDGSRCAWIWSHFNWFNWSNWSLNVQIACDVKGDLSEVLFPKSV